MENEITWRCEACGDVRKDEDISVIKGKTKTFLSGLTAARNVKYCNDEPACLAAAQATADEWENGAEDEGENDSPREMGWVGDDGLP